MCSCSTSRRCRPALGALLGDVPDLDDLEQRVGGRFNAILLSVALMGSASAGAQAELELRRTLPELGRAVMGEAAARPA